MMSEDVGRSVRENSGVVQRPDDLQGQFSAPVAGVSYRQQAQPSWMSAMEVPRWFSKAWKHVAEGSGSSSDRLGAESVFEWKATVFNTAWRTYLQVEVAQPTKGDPSSTDSSVFELHSGRGHTG